MRIQISFAVPLEPVVTIFAVQNIAPTAIQSLFWNVTGSLALILMVTLSLGILIGLMLMIPAAVRGRIQTAEFRRSIKSHEARLVQSQRAAHTGSAPHVETGDVESNKTRRATLFSSDWTHNWGIG